MKTTEWITLSIALWGAFMGTVAWILQVRNHRADRAIPKLDAVMSLKSEQNRKTRLAFSVEAINHGRRVIRIDRVGIEVPPNKASLPEGVTMERSELVIFQSEKAGKRVDLEEGDKFTFHLDPFPRELLPALGSHATAFVEDTRGKRHRAKFQVIQQSHLPKE